MEHKLISDLIGNGYALAIPKQTGECPRLIPIKCKQSTHGPLSLTWDIVSRFMKQIPLRKLKPMADKKEKATGNYTMGCDELGLDPRFADYYVHIQ